ncbi:MAG: hypothetical protein M0Z77_01020, partial [Thermoplasmatales archaeon]|nr:hypothetical protein [Thermoplasmatales archaeon]
MKRILPIIISLLLVVTTVSILALPGDASASSAVSGQAVDIEQGNAYTYAELFSTGYSGNAYIPSGAGLIQYTADLGASSSSIAEIQILSPAGQILSTAQGPGYYVKDNFNFSFVGESEYVMELFYSTATSSPSTSIASTSNGILAESQDGYTYALTTNSNYSGMVFTATQNVTSSSLQATVYVYEMGSTPPPSDGKIHFLESGLPNGASWSIVYHSVLNGYTGANTTLQSTSPEINLTLALGNTIYYWVTDSSGSVATPSHGILNLDEYNMTITISFPSPAPSSYPVVFIPQGIPSGVTWGVGLNGIWQYQTNLNGQNPDIVFSESTGSYSFSTYIQSPYSLSPSSGTISVSSAAVNESLVVNTPAKEYTMTFSQSGLSSGVSFTVSIGPVASGTSAVQFIEPNGTYYFTIANVVSGGTTYVPSPNSGKVTVNGGNQAVSVAFTGKTYSVTFTESGLSTGTLWGVSLDGQAQTSAENSITFGPLAQGAYNYNATASGYSTISGSVQITSSSPSNIAQTLKFSSSATEVGPPSVTISSSQDFYINGTVVPPSGYPYSGWSSLGISASSGPFTKSYPSSPPAWNFSIQVPYDNSSYNLSFRLYKNNIQSGFYNTSVVVSASSEVLPTYYSITPSSGSVILSSVSIELFLKGPVTYSGELSYSSAYGQSSQIAMNQTKMSNGTQILYYPLDIGKFPVGQYSFKFLVIYNNKTQVSLNSEYIIDGPNAITLKYFYTYEQGLNGLYNLSFNVSVIDNSSLPYSPVNVIQVSSANNANGALDEIGYIQGKPLTSNGNTRDYFTFNIRNLSKGSYELNVMTLNRTGNELYQMFSSNYSYQ